MIITMKFDEMEMRRRILRLIETGDTTTVAGDFEAIAAKAERFGKSRGIPVVVTMADGGALITRAEPTKRHGASAYPEIVALQPGGQVLIKALPANHHRVRLAASQIGRRIGSVLRCMRTGDDIMVIRVDGADDGSNIPMRETKYGLERLEREPEITVNVEPRDQRNLRVAVSQKAKTTGWTIRCRLQDDGSMLVYRTDAGAPRGPAASQQDAAIT